MKNESPDPNDPIALQRVLESIDAIDTGDK
jgi:hypothetical protein